MDADSREYARQQVVLGIVSRLHTATCDAEDYRSVFADLGRQLLDRMDAAGDWRTPTRHALTEAMMRNLVDGPIEAHSCEPAERGMAYADVFEKVSVSVTSGIHAEHARAEFERRDAA